VIDPGCQGHGDSFFQHVLNGIIYFNADIAGIDAFNGDPCGYLWSPA
jgi:hypothetical protein